MKCSNCGAELKEEARFCQLCGQSVENSAPKEKEADSRQAPRSGMRKKAGPKLAAGVIAILLAAVVAFAAPKVYQKMKTSSMSPTEYYQYVEEKNRDEKSLSAMDYYNQALNNFWNEDGYNKNINMKISVSDATKSMLSMTGIDCSNLADIGVDETINIQENEMAVQLVANANDDRLISYKIYCDYENNRYYVQIPEMSEDYVDISPAMQETEDGAAGLGVNALYGMVSLPDIMKLYPKAADIKAIYFRYTDLYIDSVKNVEKTEGSCQTQGVSQKADKYTVIFSGEELAEFSQKLFSELKEDENVKTIVENIDEETYTAFMERLEELEADTGADSETTIVMDAYITEDEKIIGRTFTLSDDGANELKISYLCPTDGDSFGVEFLVSMDGEELVKLSGNGTTKNEKMSGDFVLGVGDTLVKEASLADSSSLLKITLEDYDFSKLSEGSASGTMVLSTGAVAQLANCSLKYDFAMVQNDGTGALTVMMGQEALLTIDMKVREAEKLTDVAPKDGDKVYDITNDEDMEEFAESFDDEEFMENLLDKLGIDAGGLMGFIFQNANPL